MTMRRLSEKNTKILFMQRLSWATRVQAEGVRHPGTADALSYLIKHADLTEPSSMHWTLPHNVATPQHESVFSVPDGRC